MTQKKQVEPTVYNRDPKFFFDSESESKNLVWSIVFGLLAGLIAGALASYVLITFWVPKFIPAFINQTPQARLVPYSPQQVQRLPVDDVLPTIVTLSKPKDSFVISCKNSAKAISGGIGGGSDSTACPYNEQEFLGSAFAINTSGVVIAYMPQWKNIPENTMAWDLFGKVYEIEKISYENGFAMLKIIGLSSQPSVLRTQEFVAGERFTIIDRKGFEAKLPSQFNERQVFQFTHSGKGKIVNAFGVNMSRSDILAGDLWSKPSVIIDEQGSVVGFMYEGIENKREILIGNQWQTLIDKLKTLK